MQTQSPNSATSLPVKIALLGASRIAAKIQPVLRQTPEIQILGVAAQSLERAQVFAQTHELKRSWGSYAEALSDPEVEAVYISTLNSQHVPLIRQSLLAKKHVLCEKPLALSRDEAREVFALAEKQGVILVEGFMYRFHPHLLEMRNWIRSGKLGEIRSVQVTFSFSMDTKDSARRTRQAGGGAIADLGCYALDFAQFCLEPKGQPEILGFQSQASSPGDDSVDTDFRAILRYPGGQVATLECSLDQASACFWEVRGTLGALSCHRFSPHLQNPEPLLFINEDSEPTRLPISPLSDPREQFRREFAAFARCVRKIEAPWISAEESIRNAGAIEDLRKLALRSGRS